MATSSIDMITSNSGTISPPPKTDDPLEMIEIGKKFFTDNPQVYTERLKAVLTRNVNKFLEKADTKEKENAFYRSVYDYWVYGNDVAEDFLYGFPEKSHEEKSRYVTRCIRMIYVKHLNKNKTFTDFKNKYSVYKALKKYYRREVINITGEGDYDKFLDFVKEHPVFVVKPARLSRGHGIRKDSVENYHSPRELFDKILAERKFLKNDTSRDSHLYMDDDVDVMLEELIEVVPEMKRLNPSSVNSLRMTTIRVDGDIHIFYPWVKAGVNGRFVDNAHSGGVFAGINPRTGIVETDFYDEIAHYDKPFEYHPDTNIKIRGFEIPRWNEAIALAKELTGQFENLNYMGWDIALTENGWVVIEANEFGDLDVAQIVYKKGLKSDLEELIDWKFDKEFWWQ